MMLILLEYDNLVFFDGLFFIIVQINNVFVLYLWDCLWNVIKNNFDSEFSVELCCYFKNIVSYE